MLRDAIVRRMGPLDRLDARIFLAFNAGKHAHRQDLLAAAISTVARGGWVWIVGVIAARALGKADTSRALRSLVNQPFGV